MFDFFQKIEDEIKSMHLDPVADCKMDSRLDLKITAATF